jgi:hypothetical protein
LHHSSEHAKTEETFEMERVQSEKAAGRGSAKLINESSA